MLCLSISGFDADPDEVSNILGIQPTSVGRKSDILFDKRLRNFNGWWLNTHKARLSDIVQHHTALELIVSQIRGKEDRFAELRNVLKPNQISIYGGFYQPIDQQCGISLDPSQMLVLAKCGIEWGLDLFVEELNEHVDPPAETQLIVEKSKPHYTLDQLMNQCDLSADFTAEDKAWLANKLQGPEEI